MKTIYANDLMNCISKVALRSLARYERDHPEFESLTWADLLEVRRKLLRKAFEPKIGVKMVKRLLDRGYAIIPGDGPERTTVRRIRDRFGRVLCRTIDEASARLENVQWQ